MPASIFSGSKVKILKDRLVSFSDKDMIVVQSDDPTSSAVNATKGTILINPTSAAIYKKNDDGSSTNWTLLDFDASNDFSQLKNLGFAASVGASALTIDLKQSDGSTDPSSGNPVIVGFRNATSTTGGYDLVSITGALTMTVPSGATLGAADGVLRKNWIYLINNAGTAELAISSVKFADDGIVSTTALSSGSDSSGVMYSTSARSNVPVRLIGFLESTQTTAGTWASSPTKLFAGEITAGEKVSAKYDTDAAQSIDNNTIEIVNFDGITFGWDSHNAVTTGAAWKFTAPVSGKYDIKAAIQWVSKSWTEGNQVDLYLFKNGVYHGLLDSREPQNTGTYSISLVGSNTVDMSTGDYIDVRAFQNSGAGLTLAAAEEANYISISKID